MQSFIINLPSSTIRREAIIQQCEKHNINYEMVAAVDGRKLTEEEIIKLTKADFRHWLMPAEIGCSLSHISIYKKIITENIDIALILEDDAILPENFNEILSWFEKNNHAGQPTITLLNRADCIALNGSHPINETHQIVKYFYGYGSHAYIINRLAAEKLYKFLTPVWLTADDWRYLHENKIVHIQAVYPEVVTLSDESGISTIAMVTTERASGSKARRRSLTKNMKLVHKITRLKNQLIRPWLEIKKQY